MKYLQQYVWVWLFIAPSFVFASQPPAVTVQTAAPPATLTTAIAAAIAAPAFYEAWKLPEGNGRGVVEFTLATAAVPNVTIFILGDEPRNFNNVVSVSLGGATADKAQAMAVGTGVAPGVVGAGWAFTHTEPVIAAATDVRVQINQDIALIVVATKPQGAPATEYETVLVYSDYNAVNGAKPTAFAALKGKATYFGFGTVGSASTITNVKMSAWEAELPTGFTQKISGTDALVFGDNGVAGSMAYSISMDKRTLTSMNMVNAVSSDIMALLNTWQPVAVPGVSVSGARIESFAINAAKQCFIGMTDGAIYKAPAVAGPFTSLVYNKGAIAPGPISISSGKTDVIFILDKANALWRLAGVPLAPLREGPQQPAGTYLPIVDVSQGADGTVCAVDAAGGLWTSSMPGASPATALVWTKFASDTAMVGTVAEPVLFESVCVVNAKNIAATTSRQQVGTFDGTKWSILPSYDGPTPACGFVSVTFDAAGNTALFDANGNLFTNFPPVAVVQPAAAATRSGVAEVAGQLTQKQKDMARLYGQYKKNYALWSTAGKGKDAAKTAAALKRLNASADELKKASGLADINAALKEAAAAKALVDEASKKKEATKANVTTSQKKSPPVKSSKTSTKKGKSPAAKK